MDAYVGLGTNLGRRRHALRRALAELTRRGLAPSARSSVWETEPVDAPGSPWFLNMVVRVPGLVDPESLLDTLLAIERAAGRRRDRPNGPRVLDLDLLLVGRLRVRTARLHLPHPRMWLRRFVLAPLAQIAPRLENPATGRTVSEELLRLGHSATVRRLGPLSPAPLAARRAPALPAGAP